jgi:hypothetical protein
MKTVIVMGTSYFFAVIASAAKQSIVTPRDNGLLRRFAPRNDGAKLPKAA